MTPSRWLPAHDTDTLFSVLLSAMYLFRAFSFVPYVTLVPMLPSFSIVSD